MPDNIPVDLKAKLIVCLIHLHVITPLEVGEINIFILTLVFFSMELEACEVLCACVPSEFSDFTNGTESRGDW